MSSGAPSHKGADNTDDLPALTRHNLKRFNIHNRKETARRRGRSTPSASPDLHSYYETVSSTDLPPPSQRPMRRIIKQTASELAAEAAILDALFAAHPPRHAVIAQGPSASATHDSKGQPDSPHRAASVSAGVPASVSRSVQGSILENGPDNSAPQYSVANDAASKTRSHSGLVEPVAPGTDSGLAPAEYDDGHPEGQYDNGHPVQYHSGYPPQYGYPPEQYWGYASPQPGLPDDRPPIPRQQPSDGAPGNSGPQFPPNFPAYHCTQNMNEIAAYLANASYVVALGGPPLADLKYGIVIVPAGEEKLLFGPRPSQSLLDQNFVDAIDDANRDYDRALRMHDPDKDSEEFVRHRFDDDFASVSAAAQQNVETTLANEQDGADRDGAKNDESTTADVEEPQPKRPRRGPQRKPTRVTAQTASARNNAGSSEKASSGSKRAAPAMDTVEAQGKMKTRRSTRVAGRGVEGPSKPAAKRTLRGKK